MHNDSRSIWMYVVGGQESWEREGNTVAVDGSIYGLEGLVRIIVVLGGKAGFLGSGMLGR